MTEKQPEALLLADVHEDGTELGDKTAAELRRLYASEASLRDQNTYLDRKLAEQEKVMQQALEALENLATYDSRPSNIWTYFYASATGDYVNLWEFKEKAKPAITALREQLGDKQ